MSLVLIKNDDNDDDYNEKIAENQYHGNEFTLKDAGLFLTEISDCSSNIEA